MTRAQRRKRKRRITIVLRCSILIAVIILGKRLIVDPLLDTKPQASEKVRQPAQQLDKEHYPEQLLDMLARNEEMLDYVSDFPQKKGTVSGNTVGEVQKGTFPLLLQWDKRWGYGEYGGSYIAINGCAPTALSMVVAGLTGKNSVTPYKIAKYAEKKGYYVEGVGTSWELMTKGSKHYGVQGTELGLSKDEIFHALEGGNPIICSMLPGDFTTEGHFIVLIGVKDGKIQVNDPNSRARSENLWNYDKLKGQIKNLWVFEEI